MAFARRFGDLEDHPVAGRDPENPGLVLIHRADKKESYENSFHSDGMWRPNPAMGAVLRCIECPPLGGDTLWVNMVQAYANLPEDIKQLILPLRASNSIEHSFGAVMEPEARRNPQVADDYGRWFSARLKGLEPRLAANDGWYCAGRFTAADISVGYALLLAETLGLDQRFSPAVADYWARLQARDGFVRAKAAQSEAPAPTWQA